MPPIREPQARIGETPAPSRSRPSHPPGPQLVDMLILPPRLPLAHCPPTRSSPARLSTMQEHRVVKRTSSRVRDHMMRVLSREAVKIMSGFSAEVAMAVTSPLLLVEAVIVR